MDLRKLGLFLAVVDEGGFTRAALAEFVSQPSVSQAIRELEAELGTPLFHRVGRGVTLTAAGEALVGPARQTLRDVEMARAAVSAVGGLEAGRLDLCALPTLAVDPVAPLTGAFRTAYPGVSVTLADAEGPAEVASQVMSGDAEIGITVEHPANDTLRSVALGRQEMLVVLPPGTPASHAPAPRRGARQPPDRHDAAWHVDASVARRGVRGGSGHAPHRGGHRRSARPCSRSCSPARARRCCRNRSRRTRRRSARSSCRCDRA